MATALGTATNPIRRQAGAGEVRERTIVIDRQVIVVDNIGSIAIVAAGRSWWLANFGLLLVLVGAATLWFGEAYATWFGAVGPRNSGLGVAGLGAVLMMLNIVLPARKGLGIGTNDGGATIIVSRDESFLQRLLTLLIEKVDTRNEALTAHFDIANARLTPNAARPASHMNGPPQRSAVATKKCAPTPPPPVSAPPKADNDMESADEALFVEEGPQAAAPKIVESPLPVHRTESPAPRDPLLDGPRAVPGPVEDWLGVQPDSSGARQGNEPGAARWLVPSAFLMMIAAAAFAAWYFISQQGSTASPSLIGPPQSPPAPPASPDQALLAAPRTVEKPVSPFLAEAAAIPETAVPASAEPAPPAVVDFAPDLPIVARSSGQRFRAEPSAADSVDVLGETRAGGELLAVNGRTMRPDGEWYRLTLSDGREAWIKASLTVPRDRFSETMDAPTPGAVYGLSSPIRVFEPAEGVQIPGGAQRVRLAWSTPSNARYYIVEIEAYDAISRRWIEDPLFSLITVESVGELLQDFPYAGHWRWRVRGVSDAGDQSPFSRWAAFEIRY